MGGAAGPVAVDENPGVVKAGPVVELEGNRRSGRRVSTYSSTFGVGRGRIGALCGASLSARTPLRLLLLRLLLEERTSHQVHPARCYGGHHGCCFPIFALASLSLSLFRPSLSLCYPLSSIDSTYDAGISDFTGIGVL